MPGIIAPARDSAPFSPAGSEAHPDAATSTPSSSASSPAAASEVPSLALLFARLPTELRIRIWCCAVEPRLVILDDLLQHREAYPLPSVAQVNRESRLESRAGYEAAGPGGSSHVHFSRDIFVCDATITETTNNEPLEALATRVERLAFWDCYPDDKRVELPYFYSTYLAAYQAAASAAMIAAGSAVPGASNAAPRPPAVDFDKLWFPNLRDLWIVKVGGVHNSWLIDTDLTDPAAAATGMALPLTQQARSRQTARKFRYWVQDNVVEMASLSLDDPDTRLVLREGRCDKHDCQDINRGRPQLVSKVTFMDGEYMPSEGWLRVAPWDGAPAGGGGGGGQNSDAGGAHMDEESDKKARKCSQDSMRWIVVERILTFSLRWESSDDTEEVSRRHIGGHS